LGGIPGNFPWQKEWLQDLDENHVLLCSKGKFENRLSACVLAQVDRFSFDSLSVPEPGTLQKLWLGQVELE